MLLVMPCEPISNDNPDAAEISQQCPKVYVASSFGSASPENGYLTLSPINERTYTRCPRMSDCRFTRL